MIIDITGELYTGMWNYEPPFPTLTVKPLPPVPWVKGFVGCEIFDGLHSQSGTYLETPAHVLGDASYPLIDVPLERLVAIPTVVLHTAVQPCAPIDADTLRHCTNFDEIHEGDAILVSCADYGRKWYDKDYLDTSPYFTTDAMNLLISRKPFLLGSDFPRWDNLSDPQCFFDAFYHANILMLAPVVRLADCPDTRVLLTALPLKAAKTSCAPCRAFVQY